MPRLSQPQALSSYTKTIHFLYQRRNIVTFNSFLYKTIWLNNYRYSESVRLAMSRFRDFDNGFSYLKGISSLLGKNREVKTCGKESKSSRKKAEFFLKYCFLSCKRKIGDSEKNWQLSYEIFEGVCDNLFYNKVLIRLYSMKILMEGELEREVPNLFKPLETFGILTCSVQTQNCCHKKQSEPPNHCHSSPSFTQSWK